MSERQIVIVGGGMAALMTALFLRRDGFTGRIAVIERAPEVGGLLRAIDAGEFGRFDQGMHTFTSTRIPELDDVMTSLLPAEDWVWLKDETRDISGVAFEGRLQRECHYPDLRLLPDERRRRAVACLESLLDQPVRPDPPPTDMEDYATRRFGCVVAREVISPILEKLYGRPAREIDPVVAGLLPLDRVALYDEACMNRHLDSDLIRSRIAYPEQRRLPLRFASGRFSVYPKAFGAWRVVDALVEQLRAQNVEIVTRAELTCFEARDHRVRRLAARTPDGTVTFEEPTDVYWTAGTLPLARTLGVGDAAGAFEAPKSAAVMNLLIDHRPYLDDLYYFWCFDSAYQSFRVTNFAAYCPNAERAGGYPICVEFFLNEGQPRDHASIVDLAVNELRAFGAIDSKTRVLHATGHALPVGFPILSLKNRAILNENLAAIAGLGLDNLAVTGIQSEWGVVFQPDVVTHAWRTVAARRDIDLQ
jgi:protoporphyrinogen oxidase